MSRRRNPNRGRDAGAFPAMRACPLCDSVGQPAGTQRLIKAFQRKPKKR